MFSRSIKFNFCEQKNINSYFTNVGIHGNFVTNIDGLCLLNPDNAAKCKNKIIYIKCCRRCELDILDDDKLIEFLYR